jgi:hypothetical protein
VKGGPPVAPRRERLQVPVPLARRARIKTCQRSTRCPAHPDNHLLRAGIAIGYHTLGRVQLGAAGCIRVD